MASRLLDAHAEIRVRFVENGEHMEFVATVDATRALPMVTNFERDSSMRPNPPGGKFSLESRGSIYTERRRLEKLPEEVHASIEKWLAAKRRELQAESAKKVANGAEAVKISESGEVRKA